MRIAMIGLKGIPATTGGIERHVEELAPRLVKAGAGVTAYCRRWYSAGSGPFEGVERVWKPTIRTKHLDAITHSLLSTASAVRSGHDIIHFHALGPASLSFIPRLLGRRVVVTVHGLDYLRAKWGAFARFSLRRAEGILVRCAHRVIVVSDVLAGYFEREWGIEAAMIPNGVRPARLVGPRLIRQRWGLERRDYVLSLGRLVPEKRVEDIIQAFGRLVCGLKLVVAGDAGYAESYAANLRGLAAEDERVVFTGPVVGDELCELYSNAAAFVQASEMEGLPIAILEALSYGLPVICSDIPEHLEIVDAPGGPFAAWYPAGDVDALVDRIERALADPSGSAAMGLAGSRHVARLYDWDAVAARTMDVYREAMEEGGA